MTQILETTRIIRQETIAHLFQHFSMRCARSKEHNRPKGKGHFMVLISLPEMAQGMRLSIQKRNKANCLPYLNRAHA